MIYDLIVAGAGASGMTAAICATDADIYKQFQHKAGQPRKRSVLIIEKNKKIGKKLYATGNGRCNLSNSSFRLECYNSKNEFFPYKVIGAKDYQIVNQFAEQLGVSVSDEHGYYYPMSRQASTIVWAFNDRLKKNQIQIHTGEMVTGLEEQNDHTYCIQTDQGQYYARNVVLACGGAASPALGGTDAGCSLLDQLGIPYYPFQPALCKLQVREKLSVLSGVRSKALVTVLDASSEIRAQEFGEVQFTGQSLSGIVIFNLSHTAGEMLQDGESVNLCLDLVPDINESDLYMHLRQFRANNPERSLQACLNGFVHEKLAAYILEQCGWNQGRISELNDIELQKLADQIKKLTFHVTATAGAEEAQVSRGGADTRFIDPETMKLTVQEHVYVTGELLDTDGICGGYNLMWAIITGMKAGFSIYDSN